MISIKLTNGGEISTLGDNGDGCASITISNNNVTNGTSILTANELAVLIRDLRKIYLSLAGFLE